MNQLEVIQHQGQRVLTTSQLAEAYGTDAKTISKNFERNRDRYVEGKHFYRLEGEALKAFKASRQNDENLKFVPVRTTRSAPVHRSLGTKKSLVRKEEGQCPTCKTRFAI